MFSGYDVVVVKKFVLFEELDLFEIVYCFSIMVVFVGLYWVIVGFVFILFFKFFCCLNRFLKIFEFR